MGKCQKREGIGGKTGTEMGKWNMHVGVGKWASIANIY